MRLAVDTGQDEPGFEAFTIRSTVEGYATGLLPSYQWEWRLPLLYRSGVKFRYEPDHGSGAETLVQPPVVLQRGWGDCAHLVVWRLCELNLPLWNWDDRGEQVIWSRRPATVQIVWRGRRMHVLIRRSDGQLEDPSKILLWREKAHG